MFVAIVAIFAITSDRLGRLETSSGMPNSKNANSEVMGDQAFLTDLIAHHEGAITMAQDARVKSSRPEIITFANDVISMERSNVEQTYIWRRDWYGDINHISLDKVDKKISMVKDLGVKDEKFDLRFLDAMIAHHEGAIKMLGDILVPTSKKEIHDMASSGIVALTKDIQTMKQWKEQWYGK